VHFEQAAFRFDQHLPGAIAVVFDPHQAAPGSDPNRPASVN